MTNDTNPGADDSGAPPEPTGAKQFKPSRKQKRLPAPMLTDRAVRELAHRGEEVMLGELQRKENDAAKREGRAPRTMRLSAVARRMAKRLNKGTRTRAERTATGEIDRAPSDYQRMKAAQAKRERKRLANLQQRSVKL